MSAIFYHNVVKMAEFDLDKREVAWFESSSGILQLPCLFLKRMPINFYVVLLQNDEIDLSWL